MAIRRASLASALAVGLLSAAAVSADEKTPAPVEMSAGDALGLEIFADELAAPPSPREKVAARPPRPAEPPAPPAKRADD